MKIDIVRKPPSNFLDEPITITIETIQELQHFYLMSRDYLNSAAEGSGTQNFAVGLHSRLDNFAVHLRQQGKQI